MLKTSNNNSVQNNAPNILIYNLLVAYLSLVQRSKLRDALSLESRFVLFLYSLGV